VQIEQEKEIAAAAAIGLQKPEQLWAAHHAETRAYCKPPSLGTSHPYLGLVYIMDHEGVP
jgi:hypothetical protein